MICCRRVMFLDYKGVIFLNNKFLLYFIINTDQQFRAIGVCTDVQHNSQVKLGSGILLADFFNASQMYICSFVTDNYTLPGCKLDGSLPFYTS